MLSSLMVRHLIVLRLENTAVNDCDCDMDVAAEVAEDQVKKEIFG